MWVRVFVAIVLFLLPTAAIAQTEKRVALLIGNQGYGSEIGRLSNPHNDIALLERALKGLAFEVTTVRDAGLGGLHQVVNAYARQAQAAGRNAVGFFYYSGHGAADAGVNYLIPIDVKTSDTGELWDQSLRLTEITRKLKTEAGNATHFVVFDACRNTLKLTRTGSRALLQSKGFAPVTQESGMLIAYATAEGELASDVGTEAGPYAKTLAEEIIKPGVEAVVMFRNVQRRVRAALNQEPYLGFNALGDVYFAGKDGLPTVALQEPKLSTAEKDGLPPAPRPSLSATLQVWHPPYEMKVRALAQRQGIPLPLSIVYVPSLSAPPTELEAYIGAWGGDERWDGVGRQVLILVLSVDGSGAATGLYSEGPPNPNTRTQDKARFSYFDGRIGPGGLTFNLSETRFHWAMTSMGELHGSVIQKNNQRGDITTRRIK